MNRKRIIAIGKLVVLFGTPLAVILGLFSCGVYCGVDNRAGITRFERDWLGLDVEVPGEPAGESAGSEAKSTESEGKTPDEDKTPDEGKAPAEGKAPQPTPPTTSEQPGAVPAPLPPPETRVDPLEGEQAERLAVPATVHVKVLVDQSLIDERADWIDYVQRTVSRASRVYEEQFGVRLELASVGRWTVALEGMGADELLDELRGFSREGAEILVGFTSRPFDGTTSGRADTPPEGSPFNGAYGVVYATPGHREAHLRTLLHEVAHMFGAKDIIDPEHPGWKGGSWMSYATVPESRAPWIDKGNRKRVLDRKDLPFAPEEPTSDGTGVTDPAPTEAGDGSSEDRPR